MKYSIIMEGNLFKLRIKTVGADYEGLSSLESQVEMNNSLKEEDRQKVDEVFENLLFL